MYITTFETFVAFSETGKSFLVKEKRFSPEGGESLCFIIINCEKREYQRFQLSNNFGIGNGKISQKIPHKACRTVLETFYISLAHNGFRGIDICPDACKTDEREKCISLTLPVLNINTNAFFGTENERLVHLPYYFKVHEKDFSLYKDTKKLFLKRPESPPDIKRMQAWISPDNCLILLFSFINFNHHRIAAILISDNSETYKECCLSDMKEV